MIGSILGKSSCDCEAPDSTAEPLPPNLLQRDLGIAGRHWAQGGVAVWAGLVEPRPARRAGGWLTRADNADEMALLTHSQLAWSPEAAGYIDLPSGISLWYDAASLVTADKRTPNVYASWGWQGGRSEVEAQETGTTHCCGSKEKTTWTIGA